MEEIVYETNHYPGRGEVYDMDTHEIPFSRPEHVRACLVIFAIALLITLAVVGGIIYGIVLLLTG